MIDLMSQHRNVSGSDFFDIIKLWLKQKLQKRNLESIFLKVR